MPGSPSVGRARDEAVPVLPAREGPPELHVHEAVRRIELADHHAPAHAAIRAPGRGSRARRPPRASAGGAGEPSRGGPPGVGRARDSSARRRTRRPPSGGAAARSAARGHSQPCRGRAFGAAVALILPCRPPPAGGAEARLTPPIARRASHRAPGAPRGRSPRGPEAFAAAPRDRGALHSSAASASPRKPAAVTTRPLSQSARNRSGYRASRTA